MKNKIVIEKHVNLTEARKDLDAATGKPYNEDNESHISEWAIGMVMNSYKLGEETTEAEFRQRCATAKFQQTLDSLCAKGLIEAVWDGGELTYRVKS